MEKIYRDVADMIFARGAFKFGNFKLKLHDIHPEAPLSPFYINQRTKDNPTNPGPLLNEDCDLIAQVLWNLILRNSLYFEAMAPLPYAADPIVASIERLVAKPWGFRIIKLAKEIKDGKRRIVPLPGFDYRRGEIVLPVDDLVTGADSKIEAIRAIESEGSIVKDLVVLIDRQQGGREQLEAAGYNLFSCFTIRELLAYYKDTGRISGMKYNECIYYILNQWDVTGKK